MILSKYVGLKTKGLKNLKRYKDLGYCVSDGIILVKIEDISSGSRCEIELECDSCGSNHKSIYKDYIRFNNFPNFICKGCKRKNTNLENWGVENPFQSEIIKDKIKNTNLENWGVENPFQSEIIKDKIKNTNLEKYGFYSYSKTEEFIEKVKYKKNLLYGVDFYQMTNEYKQSVVKTNMKKYGFKNPMMNDLIKQKVKETFYSKYGGFTLQSDILMEKVRDTNIKKYGFDRISKNELFRKEKFFICKSDNYIKYNKDSISSFKCDKGHVFEISSSNYYSRFNSGIELCTVCYPLNKNSSIKELELKSFIENVSNESVIRYKLGRSEIDCYLDKFKIGFEFNVLYWHSDKFKNNNYHYNKNNLFKSDELDIFHVWEDDWDNKKDIVKSIIKSKLGIIDNKIYARNCEISIIDKNKAKKFLNDNHIQGFTSSKIKIGLLFKGDLVSLMTFDQFEGRKKMLKDEFNLNRFCNKLDIVVVGGFSKLLNYFIKNFNPKRIISYADLSWSKGDLYNKNGFKLISEVKQDYKYIINGKRVHKSRFRKSFTGVSESKIDIPKIWDCGKLKYEKKFESKC